MRSRAAKGEECKEIGEDQIDEGTGCNKQGCIPTCGQVIPYSGLEEAAQKDFPTGLSGDSPFASLRVEGETNLGQTAFTSKFTS
jgi:hypothetical protein